MLEKEAFELNMQKHQISLHFAIFAALFPIIMYYNLKTYNHENYTNK